MFRFEDAAALLLLLAAPAIVAAWRLGRGPSRGLVVPSVAPLRGLPRAPRARWRAALLVLRCAALACLALALARPQSLSAPLRESASSVDVFVVLDVSSSMGSEDFQPLNRLEVAKRVIAEFVAGRPGDRVGLISFARFSTLACPLTIDHEVFDFRLRATEMARGDDDGTAIGMALASAVNHLRAAGSESRVLVLLTDGENNRSTIDPATGAAVARAFGVTVHTIGVGRLPAEAPVAGGQPRAAFNEEGLEEIAAATGGRYFRAEDSGALEEVFAALDEIEPTEVPVTRYTRSRESFAPFALAALALALAELLLRTTLLRRLP